MLTLFFVQNMQTPKPTAGWSRTWPVGGIGHFCRRRSMIAMTTRQA